MRRSLFVALLVLVVAAGACGGGDDDDTAASTTTTAAIKTTGQAAGTDFCQRAKAFADEARSVDTSSADGIKQAYEKAAEGLSALVAIAPEEIKPHIEKTNAATNRMLEELRKVDFDFSKVPPEVQQEFSDPALQEASSKLGAYFSDQCGISQAGPEGSGPPASR